MTPHCVGPIRTLAATAAACLAGFGAPAAGTPVLREGNLQDSLLNLTIAPNTVRGANDWTCQPSAQRPHPVILLHATHTNGGANFVRLGPRLKNAGYCVFSLNYGHDRTSLGRLGGHVPLRTSANQVAAFARQVRSATGAAKVDVVGYSQGGNVAMWWIKKLGGAAQVQHYVGLSPSSHGTSNTGGFTAKVPAVQDQLVTSAYTKELWADGDRVPAGPSYTVVMTRHDRVVVPYATQAIGGSNVNNVVLQDRCPGNRTGHGMITLDSPALNLVMNALADGPRDARVPCTGAAVVPYT